MTTPFQAAERTNFRTSQAEPRPPSAKRLSILLVNYNGIKYLGPCLESVLRFAPPDTEVILEDNASTDGSVEVAEIDYPWVKIVRSSQNLGFAGGNNLAGKKARGKFILLLNTDTLLLEPIAPAVDWLESHPLYGALTVNMLDGERIAQACTGRFPTVLRLVRLGSMLVSPDMYGAEDAYDVDWVQGSFLLVRADLWHSLNGLDERYFMYAEDVDFCKRIWDTGFRCAYLPHRQYLHWGGYDVSRFPDQARSLAIYLGLHMAGLQLFFSRAVLVAGCLFRAGYFKAKGLVSDHEINRSKAKASWRAFEVLTHLEA
ncbi:MAG: glycosyltransferase family 2 protein [Terracidiphilus sp.]